MVYICVLCIVGFGLLMMTSASIVISDKQLHQPFYFLYQTTIFLTLGVLLGSVIVQIDIELLGKIGWLSCWLA